MLHHKNIIGYYNFFVSDDRLNIVLEFASGGDLSRRIKTAKETKAYFDEPQILFWFVQIARALQFVHARKILHRDLKTQNIFLTDRDIVKLGDFGIARVGGRQMAAVGRALRRVMPCMSSPLTACRIPESVQPLGYAARNCVALARALRVVCVGPGQWGGVDVVTPCLFFLSAALVGCRCRCRWRTGTASSRS